MSSFSISEIRETFALDLRQIFDEARRALETLTVTPTDEPARASLWRHGHTMRGLGLQVGAGALARWGGELERLTVAARRCLETQPAKAGEIFAGLREELGSWEQLHASTSTEDFAEADRVGAGMHAALAARFGDLSAPVSAGNEAEPFTVPKTHHFKPAGTGRVRLVAPRFMRRSGPAAPAANSAEAQEIGEIFKSEVRGYLSRMGAEFALLEREVELEFPWSELHRLFHTTKGAAAVIGNDTLADAAWGGESAASQAAEQPGERTRAQLERCWEFAVALAQEIGFDLTAEADTSPAFASPTSKSSSAAAPEGMVDRELAETFVIEAREQADALEGAVLRWEKGDAPAAQFAAVKRYFHTLKGAGNSVGLRAFGASIHEVEDFLDTLDVLGNDAPAALFGFFLETVDDMRGYARALEVPGARWSKDWSPALATLAQSRLGPAITRPMASEPAAPADESAIRGTVRITSDKLEGLLNLIGETVIDRHRVVGQLEQLQGLLRELKEKDNRLSDSVTDFHDQFEWNLLRQKPAANGSHSLGLSTVSQPSSGRDLGFSDLEFDRYDQFNILSRSLLEIASDVHEVIAEMEGCLSVLGHDHDRFAQTSRQFQGNLTALSLLPMETLHPRLERAFRDAAQSEGKDATLELAGGTTQIDRALLDKLYAPLLHLLRNAVAHGIESPQVRAAANKPARGLVRLVSRPVGDRVVIELSDDGGGIDVEAVRRAAVDRGWLAADAGELSADALLELLSRPGLSTAGEVTTLAGRGTGMDVVVTELEKLNGTLDLNFTPGHGTTWRLHLPLSLLISDAVMAETGGQRFALPLGHVEHGVLVPEPLIASGKKVGVYTFGEQSCPAYRLCDLLGLPGAENPGHGMLVSVGERRVLLLVERLHGRQEMVVKPLDPLTARHPLLNGATLDAAGGVVPILNAAGLIKCAEALTRAGGSGRRLEPRPVRPRHGAERPPRILVVDDSLSVRKVQEGLIRRLGCEPVLAADGLDGLEKLRSARADLVLTDLEMPRLNGYELISEMKSVPAWSRIPVIVISSRGADKYITRAMQAGADSFLPKPFSEGQLSALLRQHLAWIPAEH